MHLYQDTYSMYLRQTYLSVVLTRYRQYNSMIQMKKELVGNMAAKYLSFVQGNEDSQQDVCKFCFLQKKGQRELPKEYLLTTAIKANHDLCAEEVIKAGLDLNSTCVNQAFRLSARREKHHILDFLIKAGVDVNIKGVIGRTALMYSARSGDHLSVTPLVRAGADINTADSEGVTPLMYTAKSGDHLCVTSLLRAGAEIHAADSKGVTVLMHMVKGGLEAYVKELIELGADVNKADIEGTLR